MVKSRKDKNQRKSSRFRGKSRKNIKVGRKSVRRKMTGGAGGTGGWDKTKGIVHNLTGVSTRRLLDNMRGSKYQSARIQPYIDSIDNIFEDQYKEDAAIQDEINEVFNDSKSILTELQPYIDNKFHEKKKEDSEREIERRENQERNERETRELEKMYDNLEKEEVDKAKIDIDNIFKDTNKSVSEIRTELDNFMERINSLTHVDPPYILETIHPYISKKLNDWSEKKINEMKQPYHHMINNQK